MTKWKIVRAIAFTVVIIGISAASFGVGLFVGGGKLV